jgi:hypothetical protein
MIELSTDRRTKQLIGNVNSLYESIKHYYMIKHEQSFSGTQHGFMFGAYPIKEHYIDFTPQNNGVANLYISEVDTDLVKKITGKTSSEICQEEKVIRKEEGNHKANSYGVTFQEKLNDFFGTKAVSLKVDINSRNITMRINLELLDDAVLDAVSLILKNTKLLPRAKSTRIFEL